MLESNKTIIDVRSPLEFHRGNIPGAINLPLLDNAQRHNVGKTYKECGPREAVEIGLQEFADGCESFLDKFHALNQNNLLVYCARGGMRSKATSVFLQASGFAIEVMPGGYKTFRNHVLQAIDELSRCNYLVLDGYTGVGKSIFLRQMNSRVPRLDFEHYANHRGSAFGDFGLEEIPRTQQQFENNIASDYWTQKSLFYVVENENFIGPVKVPLNIRNQMANAPIVLLERDLEERIEILAKDYLSRWTSEDAEEFINRLPMLKKHVPNGILGEIEHHVRNSNLRDVIRILLKYRYDPVYEKGVKRRAPRVQARFNLSHDFAGAMQFVEHYSPTV